MEELTQPEESSNQQLKEQILSDLQPFYHGAWAHMNLNRIALFGRNLNEALSPRQYERFRGALTEYSENVEQRLCLLADRFQLIRFDVTFAQALRVHAEELGKIVHQLSVQPALTAQSLARLEGEIPKHVDQLLHALRVLREQIFREFQSDPAEVLSRLVNEWKAQHVPIAFSLAANIVNRPVRVVITESELRMVLNAFLMLPKTDPSQSSLREVLFSAGAAGNYWNLEIRDTGVLVNPAQWRTVFAKRENGTGEKDLSFLSDLVKKYEGDVSVKESDQATGTTFLLRLRVSQSS